jgi:hypothetical protein
LEFRLYGGFAAGGVFFFAQVLRQDVEYHVNTIVVTEVARLV